MSVSPIPFSKPYLSGREFQYMEQAVRSGKISGDGLFTQKCHAFFEQELGFQKALLTSSGTDALEMAALLLDIQPGDEVLVPSYTFVSTANAFVLRGARIVFVDSTAEHPNLDVKQLEALITPRTRAIVPVHYAGMACDMDAILAVAARHNLAVVEDAAQAIDSFYRGRPLGSLGTLGAFSFHEAKNIIAGEGGLLTVNDPTLVRRADIIREKGTNRAAFFRGEVDKYTWLEPGSSFLPSDLTAAFLWAQLENMTCIQQRRHLLWQRYDAALRVPLAAQQVGLPVVPAYATNNAHMYYLTCRSLAERTALIAHLARQQVLLVFHYLSLHRSPFYAPYHDGRTLPWADYYTDHLVRLPLYYELAEADQDRIAEAILEFYDKWDTR
ncbi:dTDP-4-amino-4,6-dideoxygalactose transaminase [Hymenobacter aerilatus]|uniref:dTDP-4-amino-4,6-dideoxygalactose transaminase n=1 Tax=Hymenobacter aerilatus TaxID=2932251 RepID=A0A8T9T123_9BACT|nr:dTDP-4-amino-4,6-dideoxygalactose transaminase [Hymenobacter aerilatus]UOR06874.1 dTDP-4-amino-4,6-dideoxygalactose transaminase [Hymenobacter aerilatus]